MGRMLDALKNLEYDPGATMAVTAPVVVKPQDKAQAAGKPPIPATASAADVTQVASSPAAMPVGPDTIGNAFLSKLASSSRPANEADRSAAVSGSGAPSASVVSAAAAALAKLKSGNAPTRPIDVAPSNLLVSIGGTVAPSWPNPAAPAPVAATIPVPMAPPAAPPVTLPPVAPALEKPVAAPAAVITAIELPPSPQSEIALPAQRSSATRLEETVKAALADPRRSVPLEQLARRMRSELRADAGRCWLLADAGGHHDSTDLAAHLGAIFASQLGDVLLVDGNLECALLSAGMNVIDQPGIAQTAVGGAKSWHSLIQPTSWQHLFVLPAGQMVADMPDPTAAWTEVLSQAERRFRLVLVDGGPATEAACKVFGRLCDATFVVVRLGLTEAREARQAMKQLRTSGARVIGSIATSVPSL